MSCSSVDTPKGSTLNRGYAHAVFRRLKDSQKVMRAQFTNPFCVRDKILRVLYSKNPSDLMLHSRPVTGRTIWVSNVPYSATSREIAALFAPYGKICRVNLRASLLVLLFEHHLRRHRA